MLKGMNAEAIAAADSAVALDPSPITQRHFWRGYLYGMAGATETARVYLDSLLAQSRREHVHPAFIALIQEAVGDTDGLFATLERIYDEGEGVGYELVRRYGKHRDDPRWLALARRDSLVAAKLAL